MPLVLRIVRAAKFSTLLALVTLGCNKNHDEPRANATAAPDTSPIADFPSLEAKAWVNGNPVSLADARGKHVVLIEAWHPA
ncbi:MAG TPA: hypothetical protein PKA58_22930 [Polyangium sp.]|nr:hypothetical protein [Polyangium sp.]